MNKSRIEKLERTVKKSCPEEHQFKIVVLGEGKNKFFVDGVEVDEVTYNSYPIPKDIDIKVTWVDHETDETRPL